MIKRIFPYSGGGPGVVLVVCHRGLLRTRLLGSDRYCTVLYLWHSQVSRPAVTHLLVACGHVARTPSERRVCCLLYLVEGRATMLSANARGPNSPTFTSHHRSSGPAWICPTSYVHHFRATSFSIESTQQLGEAPYSKPHTRHKAPGIYRTTQ